MTTTVEEMRRTVANAAANETNGFRANIGLIMYMYMQGAQGVEVANRIRADIESLAGTDLGREPKAAAFLDKLKQAADRQEAIHSRPAPATRQEVTRDLESARTAVARMEAAWNGLGEIGMGQAKYDEKLVSQYLREFAQAGNDALPIILSLKRSNALEGGEAQSVQSLNGRWQSLVSSVRQMGFAI